MLPDSPAPVNISAVNYGTPTDVHVRGHGENGKFVVSNGGKPIKAKLVGDPALLAEYV
jgi:hypothetical protein